MLSPNIRLQTGQLDTVNEKMPGASSLVSYVDGLTPRQH